MLDLGLLPTPTVTFPGHEPYDMGSVRRRIEWELQKAMLQDDISTNFSAVLRPRALDAVVSAYRRAGIPANRAYFDEDDDSTIVVEIMEPRGYG